MSVWVFAAALVVGLLVAPEDDASAGGGQGRRADIELTGHLKPQLLAAAFDDDSALRDVFGSTSGDVNVDARVNFEVGRGRWDVEADAQVITLYGDTIEASRTLPLAGSLQPGRFPEDSTRLFDLTHVALDERRFALLTRLDRLSVGLTGRRGVLRFGRQAVTWGNGFLFNPMDIFNPFDPTAVDKEYKTGDDMLYGQLLRARGDDLQGVVVLRRDPLTGDVEQDRGSVALKYHALFGAGELDVLVAEHYGDGLLGVGGNLSVGGAVWRGDVIVSDGEEVTVSAVTSLSASWMTGGKNTSGAVELYYNGFGQSDGRYGAEDLVTNPALLERVGRGELFNLGRAYLAASATIEITPLFLLTPNVFVNVEDPSGLLQIVAQRDLQQDLLLQFAVALPLGADGTEYGGIPAAPTRFLSNEASLFVQLAWYF